MCSVHFQILYRKSLHQIVCTILSRFWTNQVCIFVQESSEQSYSCWQHKSMSQVRRISWTSVLSLNQNSAWSTRLISNVNFLKNHKKSWMLIVIGKIVTDWYLKQNIHSDISTEFHLTFVSSSEHMTSCLDIISTYISQI